MRRALSAEPPSDGTAERISLSADFHMAVLAGACNSLLTLQAAPIYTVLKQRMSREPLNDTFGCQLHDEHQDIYDVVIGRSSKNISPILGDAGCGTGISAPRAGTVSELAHPRVLGTRKASTSRDLYRRSRSTPR